MRRVLMKRMKRIFKFMLLILLPALTCPFAQSRQDLPANDSVNTFIIPNKEIDDLIVPGIIRRDLIRRNILNLSLDSSTVWLRARMLIGEMYETDPIKAKFKSSILNPLGMQLSDLESMSEIRSILSALGAGTAGYLAYEHIKKYGFLKK
jgi:hypothetical protein